MNSVELFAGAGGLAIGMSNAGFRHVAVIERDEDACETFRENQSHHSHAVEGWHLEPGDVHDFDYTSLKNQQVRVVSGGPPCQPFSLGGKHRGYKDDRDLFPEAVRAVRELKPKAFIFENVKGLMREAFADYFEYIRLQLSHPDLARQENEDWQEHRARLERHHTARGRQAEYNVVSQLLNAANYGVPQRRERVFLVGFRADLGIEWNFPEPTHSEDALLHSQWVTGDYWDIHRVGKRARPTLSKRQSERIQKLRDVLPLDDKARWRTVRDACADLPDPVKYPKNGFPNHNHNPGARSYPGHTGSRLDEPSKTLKAGDHGVPGGENMLARYNGRVRYFTVREVARLQTFPDDYVFRGAWSQAMRQLGNAVPVRLAQAVASSVANTLMAAERRGMATN